MEIIEQIGFIHFWGLSPAIDFLDDIPQKDAINVLLLCTSDLRHVLKTIADNCISNKDSSKIKKLNIYVYEKQKESFCRWLLLLQILQTTSLSFRERVELFLDVFGNAMIREKSQRYIDSILPTILNLIAEETKKTRTPLEQIFDFKEVKFKERDELSDIVNSWHSKIPFTMEKHRDQRLRYHYKERYDFRKNLIDWDYQMGLKDFASIIHFYHYREWRQTGIAFEQRFSSYIVPNRTMSSYIPGKKKLTYENVVVRGYWGDIIISPYISMGVECDVEPEKEKLFKISNMQHVGHSVEVTEFNLQYWLQMIEKQEEYHLTFTDPYRSDKNAEEKKKEAKRMDAKKENEEIKEEENEEDDEEEEKKLDKKEKEEDKKEEQDKQEEKKDKKEGEEEEIPLEKPKDSVKQEENKKEDLSGLSPEEIEQRQKEYREKKEKEDYLKGSEIYDLLEGFKQMNIKIIPIFEELPKLTIKKKFQEFFDIGVVGFIQSGILKDNEFLKLFNKDAFLYFENTNYIVPLKKDERKQYNEKIVQLASEVKLKHCPEYNSQHHYKFTIQK
ncbi:hypothetical protein ABPG74_011171 [Tetrahymena malaccensis]